jgi:hypothetical protein
VTTDRDSDGRADACTDTRPVNANQLRRAHTHHKNKCFLLAQHMRYYLIRLMSCPVPYLSAKVPVIGGRTVVEIALMLIVCIIVMQKACEDFKDAGKVLDYLLAVMVILGMRNNILTLMFGISYDRAIYVHKLMGVLSLAVTVVHALNGLNDTGIVLLSFICLMVASYLIKPYWFEAFLYSHIISFIIIAPISVIHDSKAQYFGYTSALWGLDILIRYIIRGRKVVGAKIHHLPGDVMKISFEKCFAYNAGQYCFLRIADVDPIEFHPMSISSAPGMYINSNIDCIFCVFLMNIVLLICYFEGEEGTTFHIRALGDWTRKLQHKIVSTPNWTPDVFVEGPYGNSTIDLDSDFYDVS